MNDFYIVLSRSHTTVAMLVRMFTHKYYNHTSLAFSRDLDNFHSFGRKNPKLLLPAGYIQESVETGYFGLWPNTKIAVLHGQLDDEQFGKLQENLSVFESEPERYRYSIRGLPTIFFGIPWDRQNHYTCSGFVAYLFRDILHFGKHYSLVEPEDFLKFGFNTIYEGRAGDYTNEKLSVQH
ncbi:MAG: hypothetical protein IKU54_04130 [Oscillospiraceae bacterium]|nr:hypothetical protein [Oscillospiraceae bacterium]